MPLKDPELRKEYLKKYWAKNAVRLREKNAQWRAENREYKSQRDKAYKELNKDKIALQNKAYRENNAEAIKQRQNDYLNKNKHELSRRRREKYNENPEKYLNQSKDWREKNASRYKEWFKEYYHSNKEKFAAIRDARRTKQKRVGERANALPYFRKYIFKKFGNKCFKCESIKNLTIDHHNPLSHGYRLSEANAVLLCARCNSTKKNKSPYLFYSEKQIKKLDQWFGVKTYHIEGAQEKTP